MSIELDEIKKHIDESVESGIEKGLAKAKKEAEEEKKEEVVEEIKEVTPVIKVDTEDELEKAQNDAEEKQKEMSFGELIKAIYNFRQFGTEDNRLVYVDPDGKQSTPMQHEPQGPEHSLKTMTEGTDSGGGFLVREEHINQIYELGLEASIIRNNGAFAIPMGSDTLNVPRIDESSHASNVYGGILAHWTEEAGDKTSSEPKWGNCKLTAHELAGYTRASIALMQDSAFAIEPIIKRLFGMAWSYYEDDAFINGNGVGQPLGLQNSGCLITVTRQNTSSVLYNDLPGIWAQVLPASREKGIWLLNHEVLEDLMTIGAGNVTQASGHQMIFVARDQGAVMTPPKTIFGRPYVLSEKLPAKGDQGDIGFYDLSYYLIGDRQKLTIDTSAHVGFVSNTIYWRFTLRVDGQPWLQSALTPKNGSQTLSPFVCLSSTS